MIKSMKNWNVTKEYLLAHVAAYPALQIEDLFKFLHQSVFGCGHFVADNAKEYLLEERAALAPSEGSDVEPLAGDFCRVHLRALASTSLSPETLFRLFQLSGQIPCGSGGELEEQLICLMALCREGAAGCSAQSQGPRRGMDPRSPGKGSRVTLDQRPLAQPRVPGTPHTGPPGAGSRLPMGLVSRPFQGKILFSSPITTTLPTPPRTLPQGLFSC